MANICSFKMRVSGAHDNIMKFYHAMMQEGDIWMGRGAEVEIDFEDDNLAELNGWCKWSVQSALIDNAVSMRTNPDKWFIGDSAPKEFITLWEACERWDLDMEVYSEEPGCEFQEHYVCRGGDIDCYDCIEWSEYFVDEYDTKEEAEDDFGTIFTDEEWANREQNDYCIRRGGFENWDFEI